MMDRTQRSSDEPSVWRIMSLVTPWLFIVLLTPLSFGVAALCTDEPGNGLLSQPPCNRVAYGAEINLGAQLLLGAAAIVLAVRSKATSAWTLVVVVASVIVFMTSLVIMWSYK
jgi:hypothetical protein